MGDVVYIVVRVLVVVLAASIPVWVASRRARKNFRARFGRTPTDLEMDSLGAWLKDPPGTQTPPTANTQPPASPPSLQPQQPSPQTTFGRGPGA
jgi:hypothetical protein